MYGGLLRGITESSDLVFATLINPQYCPEPKDDEEKGVQQEEDEKYIRGRIQYAPISSRL